MEANDKLFDSSPEKMNSEDIKSKRIIRILICLIVLLLIIIIVILIFYFRKDSNSDSNENSSDESPFNIVKEGLDTHLIPKSGKYDYVLIFIHGLTGNSNENLDKFNKKDGPIPDNFKVILPCAPTAFVTRLNFNTTSWFDILGEDGAPIYEEDIVFSDWKKIQKE